MSDLAAPVVDATPRSSRLIFKITGFSSTSELSWRELSAEEIEAPQLPNVVVRPDKPQQLIDGFGVCFNELGWVALLHLPSNDREHVLTEIFSPGVGTSFSLCRMPIGANDFSTDWYSYDEVDGDFNLEHFSLERDERAMLPYISAALAVRPDLRLWASPWSPPTWMKTNKHYAGALPWPGSGVDNGITEEQVRAEGTDMFIQHDKYFDSYAEYFAKFIDGYRAAGINIEMVMPQNEFNSPQVFPSCTWTPDGLARFIAKLGPAMSRRGVKVFLGTQERGNVEQIEHVLGDASAQQWISGVGLQWAGKHAAHAVKRAHPDLTMYQTEQECGDGRNDWRYCRYTWTLIRRFLEAGASGYTYWNLALESGGVSRWGWPQNSLVTVDTATRSYALTHEYYLLKHVTHFLHDGARRLETFSWSGYENQLAFINPDGSIVVVIQNDLAQELPLTVAFGASAFATVLPADSFSTFYIQAQEHER